MTRDEAKLVSANMRKEVPFEKFLEIVKRDFMSRMSGFDSDELSAFFSNETDTVRKKYDYYSSPETLVTQYGNKNALKDGSLASTIAGDMEMYF